jgi:hypothetical protein
MKCGVCLSPVFDNPYLVVVCEICYKRARQDLKDQVLANEAHEDLIRIQAQNIQNLKTANENAIAVLEKEIEDLKAKNLGQETMLEAAGRRLTRYRELLQIADEAQDQEP